MAKIVSAIIIKEGNIFTVKQKRGVYKGMHGLPSGKVEQGETDEDALVREVKEETFCDVQIIEFKKVIRDNKNDCHVFTAKIIKQSEFIESDEIEEVKWLSIPDFIENLRAFKVENLEQLLPLLKNTENRELQNQELRFSMFKK